MNKSNQIFKLLGIFFFKRKKKLSLNDNVIDLKLIKSRSK